MAPLRLGRSYWLDAVRTPAPRLGSFRGMAHADVVIVGGGVTGCAAAYFFADAGARVILLDRARIGGGSTAASTALLMQEPDADFSDLSQRYGRAIARRVWRASSAAVADMQRTLRSLRVPAVQRRPSVYLTHDATAGTKLRRELDLRRAAGFPGRWLSADGVRRLTGLDAHAAILTGGNAQVDPYRACVALARAARSQGARLFERSRARRIVARGSSVRVELTRGRIDADWVIVATGYATPEFKPLAGRFRMMNTYVVCTPVIPARMRRAIGLDEVMLWDTDRPYHYARWTPDHRLLFGGDDRRQASHATRRTALRHRAQRLWETLTEWYPMLTNLSPEYAWEGLFAMTPDGLPYIGPHRRYPRHLFALGYGGNGMTLGFLAARSLVRMARGERTADLDLFGFGRLRRT